MNQRRWLLDRSHLNSLLAAFENNGFDVVGPRLRDKAITYGNVHSVDDLPEGWTDEQKPGEYRVSRRNDSALFGYVVGPHSWKQYLFPSHLSLWKTTRGADGKLDIQPGSPDAPKFAFVGVRACEIAAIQIQDRVFGGKYQDTNYQTRRSRSLIVAVNCGQAAETCFCVSMNTGPQVNSGFDIALTELVNRDVSTFVAESGSEVGFEYLEALGARLASKEEISRSAQIVQETANAITRELDTTDLPEILESTLNLKTWDDVATRCLSCANCTLVCPTCFCHSVVETSDLELQEFEHSREWDSCFSKDFTQMGGESVRGDTKSQYRQWTTHKLGTWVEQFGTSGCVGCGRCISWCPVGIDITEEVSKLRIEAAGTGGRHGH